MGQSMITEADWSIKYTHMKCHSKTHYPYNNKHNRNGEMCELRIQTGRLFGWECLIVFNCSTAQCCCSASPDTSLPRQQPSPNLYGISIAYEIVWCLSFHVWLTWLEIMMARSISVVVNDSFLWLNGILLWICSTFPLSLYQSMDISCFHVLAIVLVLQGAWECHF